MLPAIHVFGIHIPMYSLMLILGIVAFIITYLVIVERVEKVDRTTSNRLLFTSALGIAVLGLSALVFNSIFHSIETGKIVIGGITWLGGVIGLFPFMIFAIHKLVPKAKGSAIEYFSLIIPGLVLGHAFGRVGCFFGGCCYGKVTDSIFGVVFPEGSLAALQYPAENGASLPVFPTQLFEAVFELVLFAVMVAGYKKFKKYNVEIYLIAYGIFRFLIEFLRGDDRGSTGFFLSPAQFICILILIAAVLLILFRRGIIFKKLYAKCAVWKEEAKSASTHKKGEVSLDTLKELHEMMEKGIITEEEYNEKKKDILNRL